MSSLNTDYYYFTGQCMSNYQTYVFDVYLYDTAKYDKTDIWRKDQKYSLKIGNYVLGYLFSGYGIDMRTRVTSAKTNCEKTVSTRFGMKVSDVRCDVLGI